MRRLRSGGRLWGGGRVASYPVWLLLHSGTTTCVVTLLMSFSYSAELGIWVCGVCLVIRSKDYFEAKMALKVSRLLLGQACWSNQTTAKKSLYDENCNFYHRNWLKKRQVPSSSYRDKVRRGRTRPRRPKIKSAKVFFLFSPPISIATPTKLNELTH